MALCTIYYPMLHNHHPIPRNQSDKPYLLPMALLLQYPRPLLNLLPNRSQSQMLFPMVLPRILLALVKPHRSTLSSLSQWTNPRNIRRKAKARVKPMPQNRVLPNHLLVNLHNGNPSIPASFARRITTLWIVPNNPKLVIFSKGHSLSSKSHFHLSRPNW